MFTAVTNLKASLYVNTTFLFYSIVSAFHLEKRLPPMALKVLGNMCYTIGQHVFACH